MDDFFSDVQSYLPQNLDWGPALKFLALSVLGSLVLGILGRVVLGRRSSLNHAVSSAMGILFIYAVTVVIYTFNPGDLNRFLPPLPYVRFEGETLHLFSFQTASFNLICYQVLSMLILAFLVNLLDTFIPKGKGVIGWYLYRFLTMALAMALHCVFNWLVTTFLPGVLVTYAPGILLGILIVCLILSIVKLILGVLLSVANPFLGGIYAFFFSNIVGRQISKAFITTILLTVLVFAVESFGYMAIAISAEVLPIYIPMILAFLLLWYLLGHIL